MNLPVFRARTLKNSNASEKNTEETAHASERTASFEHSTLSSNKPNTSFQNSCIKKKDNINGKDKGKKQQGHHDTDILHLESTCLPNIECWNTENQDRLKKINSTVRTKLIGILPVDTHNQK